MTYFRMHKYTLSSAQSGFTSEFEMGSGGARSLWSPGIKIVQLYGLNYLDKFAPSIHISKTNTFLLQRCRYNTAPSCIFSALARFILLKPLRCYMIKPHGL